MNYSLIWNVSPLTISLYKTYKYYWMKISDEWFYESNVVNAQVDSVDLSIMHEMVCQCVAGSIVEHVSGPS